jgi:hypothetical protein
MLRLRWWCVSIVVVAMVLFGSGAYAQSSTSGSGSASFGAYNWQVDQGTTVTNFVGTVNATAPANPEQQIQISIPAATTIKEVHGNITLTVPNSGTDAFVIVELLDGHGNEFVSAELSLYGPGSVTLPVSATLTNSLTLPASGGLAWRFYISNSGAQTITMAIAMD